MRLVAFLRRKKLQPHTIFYFPELPDINVINILGLCGLKAADSSTFPGLNKRVIGS